MRPLEISLVVLLGLNMLLPLLLRRPQRWIAPLAALVMLAHLLLEGYRWQMLPLYVLTILVTFSSAAGWMHYRARSAQKIGGPQAFFLLLGLVVVLASAALPAIFPIPNLPKPTGPYQVGTFSTMLVDESRKELYSGNPDDPRRIMVQFWYPASPEPGAQTGTWMDHPEIIGPSLSKWLDFPPFLLDHVVYGRSHSYPDAPLDNSQAAYPVIFFSHGWNGIRVQSTFLMEELASQGYVVVSIDHTYGARVVVFPDGKVAENNPAAMPTGAPEAELRPKAVTLVNQWAGDIGFVLDTLTTWNTNDPAGRFTGRLDLEKIGVSGHSTGGGAAIEFCGRDARCKAGVGLDPYMMPVSDTVLDAGLRQPFLFLFSERFPTEVNTSRFAVLMKNSDQAQEISIKGTAHYDFSDLPLLTPLAPYLGLKGPLNAQRVLSIDRTFTLALFDQALRGGSGALLASPGTAYPELEYNKLP